MIASAGFTTRKKERGVDRHGHIVARDHLLLGNVDRQDASVDHPDLLDHRDDEEQARPPDVLELAQAEDDRSLPLRGELNG